VIDRRRQATEPGNDPSLRPVDALAFAFATALLLLSVIAFMRGVPGAGAAALLPFWSVTLILALRSARAIRTARLGELVSALAPMGLVPVEWALDPVTNLVNPTLRDGMLLRADRILFGETPSLLLQGLLTPALTEILLVGYLSFFLLVLLPAFLFWLRRNSVALQAYVQAVVLLFVTNLCLYLLVPAVGPRYMLAESYGQPLHGVLFGDSIYQMFLRTPYSRDCFPSGHTAGALLALAFTFRRLRGFFVAALPVGILCICATVLCRFHYAIDLVFAVPLVLWSLRGSRGLNGASWPSLLELQGSGWARQSSSAERRSII
jgi:PAP2 superfamily